MDRQTLVEEVKAVFKEVGRGVLSVEDGQMLVMKYIDEYVEYIEEGI